MNIIESDTLLQAIQPKLEQIHWNIRYSNESETKLVIESIHRHKYSKNGKNGYSETLEDDKTSNYCQECRKKLNGELFKENMNVTTEEMRILEKIKSHRLTDFLNDESWILNKKQEQRQQRESLNKLKKEQRVTKLTDEEKKKNKTQKKHTTSNQ